MSRSIVIELSDAAIVSCLEYSVDSTTIEHAVSNSLEKLTKHLRSNGGSGWNTYTAEELESILNTFIVQHAVMVDETAFQTMGEIVEKKINESATADIAKPLVVADKVDNVISAPVLNLYDQRRKPLSLLKTQCPNDPYIRELSERLTKEYKPGDMMQEDHRLEIAAVELVYSNLPVDMWSSNKVRAQVQNLINLHKEANS